MATERVAQRTVLPGGLRVVTEFLPAVRSVGARASGSASAPGTRTRRTPGATHYLEHLLFKGTRRRTALEISAEMDAVGGEMNAFTAKEYTCYYARVLDADLPLADRRAVRHGDQLADQPKDVDAERNVVLEEIAMNEDDPSDTVHEAFTAQAVRRHAARPADPRHRRTRSTRSPGTRSSSTTGPGTPRSTWWWPRRATSTTTRWSSWSGEAFGPVARTGAAEPAAPRLHRGRSDGYGRRPASGVTLVSRADRAGQPGARLRGAGPRRTSAGSRSACSTRRSAAACRPGCSRRCARSAAWPTRSYSFTCQHADTRHVGHLRRLPAVQGRRGAGHLLRRDRQGASSGGLTDAELDRGKGQVRGSIVLGLEDPSSRMSRLGKSELVYPRLEPVDEVLAGDRRGHPRRHPRDRRPRS